MIWDLSETGAQSPHTEDADQMRGDLGAGEVADAPTGLDTQDSRAMGEWAMQSGRRASRTGRATRPVEFVARVPSPTGRSITMARCRPFQLDRRRRLLAA